MLHLSGKYPRKLPPLILGNHDPIDFYEKRESLTGLFEDPQFDLAKQTEEIKACKDIPDKVKQNLQWMRPHEICTKNNWSAPRFISKGMDRFDINQGAIGDCFFLSSLSALSHRADLLYQVVPLDQSFENNYKGIWHFQFWQYGKWVDVVIDDRLPTYSGELFMAKSVQNNEFWLPLVEKAFAKLSNGYATIATGGLISAAMTQLTGGLSVRVSCGMEDQFEYLQEAIKNQWIITCAITVRKNSEEEEILKKIGLTGGHGYSIENVAMVEIQGVKQKLLCVRNPHGQPGREWNGAWSDKSKEWQKLAYHVKERLQYRVKNDGEFWITEEEFNRWFTFFSVCSLSNAQKEILGADIGEYTCWNEVSHVVKNWGIGRGDEKRSLILDPNGPKGFSIPENFHRNPQVAISVGTNGLNSKGKSSLRLAMIEPLLTYQGLSEFIFALYTIPGSKKATRMDLKSLKGPVSSYVGVEFLWHPVITSL